MTKAVAFRLANWDTPLWASPNRRKSRFTLGGEVVQYWSLHPLTCWAEHLRFHNVRSPSEAIELRARPWVASIDLPSGTLDVSFANAAHHGIAPRALVDDDWATCQRWASSLSAPAIIVPSPALPGTRNLVVFGPRVRSRYGLTPLNPGVTFRAIPSPTWQSWSLTSCHVFDGEEHRMMATRRGWQGGPSRRHRLWQWTWRRESPTAIPSSAREWKHGRRQHRHHL